MHNKYDLLRFNRASSHDEAFITTIPLSYIDDDVFYESFMLNIFHVRNKFYLDYCLIIY